MEPVRVIYHHEQLWWAESPDVPNWRAEAPTYEELRHVAGEQIPFALDRAVTLEHFVIAEEQGFGETHPPPN